MLPYPKELRARVVAAVEQGDFSIPEVAELFQVGKTFVKKMLRRARQGAELAPRQGGGPEPIFTAARRATLRAAVAAHPDATLAELQQVMADQHDLMPSLPTLCRVLQELNLPRKKKASSPVRAIKRRAASSVK